MAEKLLAEWFWIDRWMGSSAFLLPMEARGVYREMLTQAWRRGARLPNDHEAIQRAIGATPKEWNRTWPLIERFWLISDGHLINETQQEVYAEALERQEKAIGRAQKGAEGRWGVNRDRRSREQKMESARSLGVHTQEQWAALVDFVKSICICCDRVGYVEKDHIIPISFGGDDSIGNIQPLCAKCNTSKGNKSTDYRSRVKGLVEWVYALPTQCLSNADLPIKALPEQCTPNSDLRSPSPDSVSGHQSPSPKNGAREPVALAGTLPRDHLRHGWCSSRGKCVPDFLHEEFIRSVGGERQSADQRLRAFYEAREHGWPPGPIGDDPVKLWRREFAACFPSVAPISSASTIGKRQPVPAHEPL